MSQKFTEQQLFEQVRKLPTELSQEQIAQLVQSFPAIPPSSSHWFSKFSLNNWFMSAIIMAAIIGVTALFLNSDQEKSLAVNTLNPLEVMPVADSSVESLDTLIEGQVIEVTKSISALPTTSIDFLEQKGMPPKVDIQKIAVDSAITSYLPVLKERPVKYVQLSEQHQRPFIPINGVTAQARIDTTVEFIGEIPSEFSFRGKTYMIYNSSFMMTARETKKLHKQLLKIAQADRLAFNDKGEVHITCMTGDSMYEKYKYLLTPHEIKSREGRKIIMTQNYIVIGEFTSDGKFIRGIVQGNTRTKSKPIKLNIKRSKKTTQEQTTAIPPQQCDSPLAFKGSIRMFRRRVLQYVKSDDLLESQKNVRLSFDGEQVVLNQMLIPVDLQPQYQNLLRSHNITSCPIRMVEITNEYIAIGDITEEGFKGRMNGSADIDKLGQTPLSVLKPNKSISRNSAGSSQTEERPIATFHTLKVSGLAVVYLSNETSDVAKVKVKGMPIEDVLTSVKDGILTVTTKGEHNGEQIKVNIGTTNLKSIQISQKGELFSVDPIQVKALKIITEDVGAAWLEVEGDQVDIEMKGGDLTIAGKTNGKKVKWVSENARRGSLHDKGLTVRKQE